ncbi:Sec-independent protein translocase protein TatB [Neorhizobium sp. CSC1952]|uniref:Sec-independent protein translocase protein TatB n=1 Tax=Neorhizobium sp. CSC1952 TaxID=2978974 RepID=UPI0025A5C182|nr:Sec-independent protein translocase protein TatB [Rhizobium sp. CSC1952]WJR66890.1 Sec-independent protein translocase protein TatB [Rhizobium sp. CSC1952]
MFDIGWTELLVIAIVLIVVVGPKDLPPMLRAFGKMTANLRKMAGDFRTQFDEALRESELDDVRKTISDAQRLNPTNALRDAINPLRQMGQEIKADLQKATQVPTPAVAQADAEAQQAVEGTQSEEPVPEVPANFPSPSVTLPSTPPQVSAPAPAAAQPVAAAAPVAVAEKPKPVRKAPARAKPAAEAAVEPAEKPKRSRAAKPAPAAKTVAEAAAKAPARKRAPKKTDTPKDDA